jgi:N-acetyl-gamma-glutamyl-phosphate reductase
MVQIGVVGASGYVGAELLRLCASHPTLEVVVATGDTQARTRIAEAYPSLATAYPSLRFSTYEPTQLEEMELVFLALPHGEAQAIVPDLLKRVERIVDLSADFRLQDASLYPVWYGAEHTCPDLLPRFGFGLPELFRDDLMTRAAIAAPGCYVTAASLALAPLVRAGLIEPSGVIVDAASGVSGAGKGLKASTAFCTVDEDVTAYGLLDHRHTPEIEQVTGAQVLFTPHLVPMNRGILATCYARPAAPTSTATVLDCLAESYRGEPFIVVSDKSPSTKATLGSNSAHLTARYDPRTGWVVVLSAIDNLVKGAAGQAIQCANLLLGVEETAGLPTCGLYP